MARKVRLEYPGACYHVINRGNEGRAIFEPPGAGAAFERTLFEACESYQWRLHAYAILADHFHLALETPKANLSDGMQWLQGTWSNRFNRYHGEAGRPFRGRFQGIHVEPGHSLALVTDHIHLNPVRSRLVYPAWVGAYRWSSLWWLGRSERPACLHPRTALDEAGRPGLDRTGWKQYCEYLARLAQEDPRTKRSRSRQMSRGWAIGSASFRASLTRDLELRDANPDNSAPPGERSGDRRRLKEEEWEKQLQVLAAEAAIELGALPEQKSAPEKTLLAAAMKRATGAQNAWLNRRLKMGTPASVAEFVRRYLTASPTNAQQVEALLAKVK